MFSLTIHNLSKTHAAKILAFANKFQDTGRATEETEDEETDEDEETTTPARKTKTGKGKKAAATVEDDEDVEESDDDDGDDDDTDEDEETDEDAEELTRDDVMSAARKLAGKSEDVKKGRTIVKKLLKKTFGYADSVQALKEKDFAKAIKVLKTK